MKARTLACKFASLSTVLVLGLLALPPVQVAPVSAQPRPAYRFDLVQGHGVAVCDAYLDRLNTTEYQDPPYCDRPEHAAIPGFASLHRVPLSAEAVQALLPRVTGFTEQKNQDLWDIENARRQRDGLPLSQPLSDVKNSLGWDLKVWRYDPAVDIDNDGMPDNVVVWHGFGASVSSGICGGGTNTYYKGREVARRQTQIAYVLTVNNDRIDVFQTMTIFGHPSGGYRIPDQSERGTFSSKFRPVGRSIGIFKYQDLYYFDTFFDSWGDFQNRRGESEDIFDTLAVFLRQAGKTQQICEYLMTETDKTIQRDKQ